MQFIKKLIDILDPSDRLKAVYLLFLIIFSALIEALSLGVLFPIFSHFFSSGVNSNQVVSYGILKPFLNVISSSNFYLILILFIFMYILKTLFLSFYYWNQSNFISSLNEKIVVKLFNIYLRAPYIYHINNNSSHSINTITKEVPYFISLITASLFIVAELLISIGLFLVIFFINPLISSLSAVFFLFSTFFYLKVVSGYVKDLGFKRRFNNNLILKNIQEGLGGIKEIKISLVEEFFLNAIKAPAKSGAKTEALFLTMQQFPRLYLELMAIILVSFIVAFLKINNFSSVYIVSYLGVIAIFLFKILPSMNRIIANIQTLKYGMNSVELIAKDLKLDTDKKLSENFKFKRKKFKNQLTFRKVSFSYGDKQSFFINKVSLDIKKGQSVGLIGSSGSGKTTLLDLIIGILKPNSGDILLDNKLSDLSVAEWLSEIGYVSQFIYLLDDTIENNITFGLGKADKTKLKKVLHTANLSDFVNSLQNKELTIVGERGAKLSGGQRQRIGIARALYRNPSILILDEATSSLDEDTEAKIAKEINKLRGKITIIIVAHRYSAISQCDHIYELFSGKIIKEGKPNELLKKNANKS
jgi:ABC-type multidrug transport system fused ATPase/permease subunit